MEIGVREISFELGGVTRRGVTATRTPNHLSSRSAGTYSNEPTKQSSTQHFQAAPLITSARQTDGAPAAGAAARNAGIAKTNAFNWLHCRKMCFVKGVNASSSETIDLLSREYPIIMDINLMEILKMAKCKWQDSDGTWHDCHLPTQFDGATHGDQCVFHAGITSKTKNEMLRALMGLLSIWNRDQNQPYDFTGFQFVEGFENTIFHNQNPGTPLSVDRIVQFSQATFPIETNFSRMHFYKPVDFNGCVFQGAAHFFSSMFRDDVFFSLTKFNGDIDISGTRFEKQSSFRSTIFKKRANFGRTQFHEKVDFEWSVFEDEVSFEQGAFSKDADFGGAKFNSNAKFGKAKFRGEASFAMVVCEGHFDFASASFTSKVGYSGSTFNGNVTMTSVAFAGDCYFEECTFHGKLDCEGSSFKDILKFDTSRFLANFGEASFINASFANEATFDHVTFNSASFNGAAFQGLCSFNDAVFRLGVYFHNTKFSTAWFRNGLYPSGWTVRVMIS